MLRELNEEGTTLLMVTHSAEHAALASRTVRLLDGRVLVDAHEADVAADVAESLSAVAAGPGVSAEHKERMLRVVNSIASPESLARVTTALRRYRSDSAEYLACRRLLGVLGESMIDPLLA